MAKKKVITKKEALKKNLHFFKNDTCKGVGFFLLAAIALGSLSTTLSVRVHSTNSYSSAIESLLSDSVSASVTVVDEIISEDAAKLEKACAIASTIEDAIDWESDTEDKLILQGLMKDLGFYKHDITGTYGYLTRSAVSRFQLSVGVINDLQSPGAGRYGPVTNEKLLELCAEDNLL